MSEHDTDIFRHYGFDESFATPTGTGHKFLFIRAARVNSKTNAGARWARGEGSFHKYSSASRLNPDISYFVSTFFIKHELLGHITSSTGKQL